MVAHCSCRYTLANKCTLIQVIRKVFCKFNYNITCFWFCLYFYGYSYYMQCLVYYFLGTQQCIRVCVHESMWCLNGRLYPCVRIRRSPVGRRRCRAASTRTSADSTPRRTSRPWHTAAVPAAVGVRRQSAAPSTDVVRRCHRRRRRPEFDITTGLHTTTSHTHDVRTGPPTEACSRCLVSAQFILVNTSNNR